MKLSLRRSAGELRHCGPRVSARDGFSLVEALTAIAITGIVAGVVISRTFAPRESGEVVALVQTVQGISEAVTAYRGTVGRYPGNVIDLVSEPETGTDLCGRPMPPHLLAEWRGPYLVRRIEERGIPVGESVVQRTLRREPATLVDGSLGTLLIDVLEVRTEVARRVDDAFDADDDLSAGSIRWVATPGNASVGTLTFAMPIRGC